MSVERTLSIIKPDAVRKNAIGQILSRFEESGLRIVSARMLRLSQDMARKFYKVHASKPFYEELVSYMTTGPVFVSVLEGDNAIAMNRNLMGATDPKKAEVGTIRKEFGDSLTANAVHGSDGPQTAVEEIEFFFPELQR